MFDVGFSELMLIFVILLIVVGPERLPKLARTIGLWVGKARTIVSSVKSEVEREIRVSELKQSLQEQAPTEELKQLSNELKSLGTETKSIGNSVQSSLQSASSDVTKTIESKPASTPTPSSTSTAATTTTTSTQPPKATTEATASSNTSES